MDKHIQQINRLRAETAFCFMHAGHDDLVIKSEQLLRQVLADDQHYIPAFLRLGQVRFWRKDFTEARALLETAQEKAAAATTENGNKRLLRTARQYLGLVYWRMSENPANTEAESIDYLRLAAEALEQAFEDSETEKQWPSSGSSAMYCLAELHRRDSARAAEYQRRGTTILANLQKLPEYGRWDRETPWTMNWLDNLQRAEYRFGDRATAKAVADEVISRFNRILNREAGINRAAAFNKLSADDQDIYLTAVDIRDQENKVN